MDNRDPNTNYYTKYVKYKTKYLRELERTNPNETGFGRKR